MSTRTRVRHVIEGLLLLSVLGWAGAIAGGTAALEAAPLQPPHPCFPDPTGCEAYIGDILNLCEGPCDAEEEVCCAPD